MKRQLAIAGSLLWILASQSLFAQTYSARAYAANYDDSTVSVIDDQSRDVVATVTVGEKPSGVAISPDNTAVYVVSETAKTLSIIDPTTNAVTGTINLSGVPRGIAVTNDSAFVYVALYDQNSVEIIDVKAKTSAAKVAVGRAPKAIVLSLDGREAYVACELENAISVIDTDKREAAGTIKLNGSPDSLAVMGNGRLAATVRWLNGFVMIEPKERKIGSGWSRPEYSSPDDTAKRPFPMDGMFASGLTGLQSGAVVLWVNASNKLLYNIDLGRENYILGFTPTGAGAMSVGVSPDGKTAYVTNSEEGTVSITDLSLNAPLKKVTVGKNPRALAVGRVRVSN